MRAGKKDGRRPVFISTLARCASPVAAIAIGFFFGAQGPAYSQIESRQVAAPFSTAAHIDAKPALPKAPTQVAMPTPPPMRIMPGLEEPLVATGPVTEEENRDLDIAL